MATRRSSILWFGLVLAGCGSGSSDDDIGDEDGTTTGDQHCPEGGDQQGSPISVSFAPPLVHEVDVRPARIGVGDIDGDGFVDVAIAEAVGSGGVWVYLGDGTGQLSDGIDLTTLYAAAQDLVLADLDGDGVDDLTIGNHVDDPSQAFPAVVHFGGPEFTTDTVEIETTALHGNTYDIEVGDFDGDGNHDIAGNSDVSTWFAWGEGNRSFSVGAALADDDGIGDADKSFGELHAANLDADARDESITTMWGLATGLHVWDIAADRSWSTRDVAGLLPYGPGAAVDLDADGLAELLFGATRAVGVIWNVNGDLEAIAQAEYCLGGLATMGVPAGIAAGDFDGDGRMDVVANDPESNTLVFFGGSDSSHVLRRATSIPTGATEPAGLVTIDFDGDGDLDVVSAHRPDGGSGVVIVHLNDS